MGAVSSIIEGLDKSNAKMHEASAQVDILYELARTKALVLEGMSMEQLRTAGSKESQTVPISKILSCIREVKATCGSDVGQQVDKITAAVNSIVGGEVAKGVASVVTSGLQMLIGESHASQEEFHKYFITVEGYAIIRYDIRGWSKAVSGIGLTKNESKIVAFSLIKSSVNMKRLEINEVISVYNDFLTKHEKPSVEALNQALIDAKKIYQMLQHDIPFDPDIPEVDTFEIDQSYKAQTGHNYSNVKNLSYTASPSVKTKVPSTVKAKEEDSTQPVTKPVKDEAKQAKEQAAVEITTSTQPVANKPVANKPVANKPVKQKAEETTKTVTEDIGSIGDLFEDTQQVEISAPQSDIHKAELVGSNDNIIDS
jgi:hypothetical protein